MRLLEDGGHEEALGVPLRGVGEGLFSREGRPPDVVAAQADIGSFVQTVTRFVLESSS